MKIKNFEYVKELMFDHERLIKSIGYYERIVEINSLLKSKIPELYKELEFIEEKIKSL